MTLGFLILFPMPLYGTGYIFSKPFFRFWVVWTFLWAWTATLIITLLPLWQGRHTLQQLLKRLVGMEKAGSTIENFVVGEEMVISASVLEKIESESIKFEL